MKKDIYVIKNRINNLLYVGQSKNSAERFISHCKNSRRQQPNSLIDKAIKQYGAKNFWFEVLEYQIENYDDREKFWITKLNTLAPNGYNIMSGGSNPPSYRGIDNPLSTFDFVDEVNSLKNDLQYSQLSLSEIAKKYNTNKRTVLRINQGISYEQLGEQYPLRKTPLLNGKLTEENIQQILIILSTTYRQYEDIGKQFNVSVSTIKQINAGVIHKQPNITYPIRKYKNSGKPNCTYAQVTEIIDLLQSTDISYRQLSKCYNIDLQTIYSINNGTAKRYQREHIKYPIRKNNPIK